MWSHNFIQLFIIICFTSLGASKNTKESVNGTSLHSAEPLFPFNTSLPEEELPQHMGRENVSASQSTNNFSTIAKSPIKPQEVEHIIITTVRYSNSVSDTNVATFHKNSTTAIIANVTEKLIISTTTPSRETTRMRPHKPLKTLHDDLPASIEEKLETISADFPNIDDSIKTKTKRADYVVPIVAVILSVPLVTIIISVLYKQSKDWWQHRNYRRMDYLIEGMYNS